jgi:hypothetical protein
MQLFFRKANAGSASASSTQRLTARAPATLAVGHHPKLLDGRQVEQVHRTPIMGLFGRKPNKTGDAGNASSTSKVAVRATSVSVHT